MALYNYIVFRQPRDRTRAEDGAAEGGIDIVPETREAGAGDALPKDHDALRAHVRAFAETRLAPHSAAWDRADRLPREAVLAIGEAGLLGLIAPAALGGSERDAVSLGIVIEELARADVSCAIICWLQATVGSLIPGWGDDTVRDVNAGRRLVCLATSEEGAGTDVARMRTTAREDGDGWLISGEKIHVSLVPGADVMAVTARVEGEGKPRIVMLRVEADQPGVTCSPMQQMGARAHQLGRVVLDGVRVPRGAVMGGGASGQRALNIRFNVSRCLSPLAAIGAASKTVEDTIAFTKRHTVFGRPIATNQAISFPLVEHLTRLEAGRLLAYKALALNDRGLNATKEAAMAKWFGITSSVAAITDCLQMHGANGYLTEFPHEQRLRDTMATFFTGGTVNVMKLLLVREFFGRDFTGIE